MTKLSLTIKIDDVTSGRRIVNPHGLSFCSWFRGKWVN